ncbi:MAG TPA: 1,2-phenylacetyl-CoA epoxidase subunit PaaC [Burkholderiales bacterium]|nr:1,2-phenylacetyl-CoA epoxidase subunit PaaC [Burkholderiales bacterium]
MDPHLEYLLRLADNALILGQRLSEWCGHAPVLEEDLALANMALDLIGQARALLTLAGQREGKGRDEDRLAFLREAHEYRNVTLVELPNDDFARTTVRNLMMSAFNVELGKALCASVDHELAQVAQKSLKEVRYHFQHAADWTIRLGDGSDESHHRSQEALDALWPYTAELFGRDAIDDAAEAARIGIGWDALEAPWRAALDPVLDQATLTIPAPSAPISSGKTGRHSPDFPALLAEMQYLQRAYPGARW